MLQGKVALVLGGTGDIGSAISDALEKAGVLVCRHGFSSGEYQADLSDEHQAAALVSKVIERHKRLDIIVNSTSAPVKIAPFEKKSWADFLTHLNVQLKAAVVTTKAAMPHMKSQGGGRIINIATVYTADDVPASLSDYMTAKYALIGLTKALAEDLGKYKITVNAVSPSFIYNRFTKYFPEKLAEIIINETPPQRIKSAAEVSEAILYLVSDAADNITGVNIYEKPFNKAISK